MNRQKPHIIDILKDVTILTSNGEKEFYPAIHINDTGLFIGKLTETEGFIETGFIPKKNIIKILGGEKITIIEKQL